MRMKGWDKAMWDFWVSEIKNLEARRYGSCREKRFKSRSLFKSPRPKQRDEITEARDPKRVEAVSHDPF